MNIENIGTNFSAYLPLVFVFGLAIIGYFIAKTGWKLHKAQEVEDEAAKNQLSKSYIRQLVVGAVAVIFLIFSLFFAYGTGKRPRTRDYEKSGWMERTEKLPDEKPLAIIQQEGEANKDRTGTLPDVANEEAFQKEGEDVDKEIDTILDRWDEKQ